jgi:hypothetical protein
MPVPVPDHILNYTGNYNAGGTVPHSHRSISFAAKGVNPSTFPDGTLMIVYATYGHEHTDYRHKPDAKMWVRVGNVNDEAAEGFASTATVSALTEVTGFTATDSIWSGSNATIVIANAGYRWGILGDGSNGTINKSLLTDFLTIQWDYALDLTDFFTFPHQDAWLTPTIVFFKPNANGNVVVDTANCSINSVTAAGTGDAVSLTVPTFTPTNPNTCCLLFTECVADAWSNTTLTNWTNIYDTDGYAMGWKREVVTPTSIGGETKAITNSGFQDSAVWGVVPVYYQAPSGPPPVLRLGAGGNLLRVGAANVLKL